MLAVSGYLILNYYRNTVGKQHGIVTKSDMKANNGPRNNIQLQPQWSHKIHIGEKTDLLRNGIGKTGLLHVEK